MTPSTALVTRVLLLRHAETAAPGLFHGAESDIGLGPRGLRQARQIAERIIAVGPGAIYSSGMRRAVETAQVIGEAGGLPLRTCPELHERQMGSMSGQSRLEGWPIYEETKGHWKAGRLDFTHDGGESFLAMQSRALPAFRSLMDREKGKTIVVVAHGVVNRVLLCSMLEACSPADFDRISIDFVGVHDVRWDGSTLRLADFWPGEPTPSLATHAPGL